MIRFCKLRNGRKLGAAKGRAALLMGAVSATMMLQDTVWAVFPEPAPKVCSEFFKSDFVFTGTVVSTTELAAKGDFVGGWTYRLKVLTVFRGVDRQTVEVSTENASARFPLKTGTSYLLFVSKQQGRFWVYDGGNSRVLEQSAKQLQDLGRLKRPERGGWLEGQVVSRGGHGWAPIPRALLLVSSGNGNTKRAYADASGEFRVSVASGNYRVVVSAPGWLIKPFDLSYDDPERLSIQDGQCAQMLFVGERPK